MRTLLALLVTLAIVPAARAQSAVKVWVNQRSRLYHCPGSDYYGKTKRGEYLTEADARRRGFRPAGGQSCGPSKPAASPRGLIGPLGSDGTDPDVGPAPPDSGTLIPCTVSRLKDGDTLECEEQGAIRLIGIDSPEDDQPPFGVAATAALAALVPAGARISLEVGREPRDVFRRLLAYVWLDGRMINWEMVRHGWAVTLEFAPNLRYADRFRAAEARARMESRGLWRVGGFACRPADHRGQRC